MNKDVENARMSWKAWIVFIALVFMLIINIRSIGETMDNNLHNYTVVPHTSMQPIGSVVDQDAISVEDKYTDEHIRICIENIERRSWYPGCQDVAAEYNSTH